MELYIKSLISEKDFAYQFNGEKFKGGIVTDRMRITIFYGLDGEKFDVKNI